MGAIWCCFGDTGWLKCACHLSPADSFWGNNLQLAHMTAPKKKRKHLAFYSFYYYYYFFLSLAVFEELSTNSPVANLMDVCPMEILFPTKKTSGVLGRTNLGRKPAFLLLSLGPQGECSDTMYPILAVMEKSREGTVKQSSCLRRADSVPRFSGFTGCRVSLRRIQENSHHHHSYFTSKETEAL